MSDFLTRGITGFSHISDSVGLERIARREQMQMAWAVASALATKPEIAESEMPAVASYNAFRIGPPPLVLLAHNHLRLAAVVAAHWTFWQPDWRRPTDRPIPVEPMPGWRVLTAEELSEPLPADVGDRLPRCEIEQVRYWKPGTVGEMVFNEWD